MFQIDTSLAAIRDEILGWEGVSAQPHCQGETEFRFGSVEIGHLHDGGAVHIPFPRVIHDELLAHGLASEHPWAPDSGWTSFRIGSGEDTKRAVWLMRLSYLRYALKQAKNARDMLDQASNEMSLTSHLRTFLSTVAGL